MAKASDCVRAEKPKAEIPKARSEVLAYGQRALARVSYMTSTRAKARRPNHSNGPVLTRCVAPFWSAIDSIIHVIRNGLRWRDAPSDYGPHKTLYNRWARWSHMGVFTRILTELAAQGDGTGTLMIDATHLKAHRTASSMGLKKRGVAA